MLAEMQTNSIEHSCCLKYDKCLYVLNNLFPDSVTLVQTVWLLDYEMTGPLHPNTLPNNTKKRGADCINTPNQTDHLHLAALKYLSRLMPPLFSLKQNSLHNPTSEQTFFNAAHKTPNSPPPSTPEEFWLQREHKTLFKKPMFFGAAGECHGKCICLFCFHSGFHAV